MRAVQTEVVREVTDLCEHSSSLLTSLVRKRGEVNRLMRILRNSWCSWLLVGAVLACLDEKPTGGEEQSSSSEPGPQSSLGEISRGDAAVSPDAGTEEENTDAGDESAALQKSLDALVLADLVGLDALGLGVTVELPDGRVFESAAGNVGPRRQDAAYSVRDTRQAVGSVTKLYTSVLVMQLVEQGTLDLDQSIDAWFDFENANDITIRMLLQHTSGIADCLDQLTPEQYALEWTPEQLVELALDAEPFGVPGTSSAFYSNTNFALLALIVEAVTGESWQGVLEARIAAPLGLSETAYAGDARDLADGWMRTDDGWVGTLALLDPSVGWGYGAITSTNHELARFVKALFSGELFAEQTTLEQMLEFSATMDPSVLSEGEPPQSVGLGVIRYHVGDVVLDGHLGHIAGYNSAVLRDAETGVLLTGTTNADAAVVALTLVKIAEALRGM